MIRVRPQESPQKGAEMELAAACTLIVHNFLESLVSYAIPCEGRKWSKLPWRGSTFLLTLLISQHSRRGSSSQKVNVVKGLKLYEGIFTDSELHNLVQYINALRHAGTRGELSGETFIFFNKQMKGNKREIIQFGIPLFQPTTEEAASSIGPIPPSLQNIIDNLVLWCIIPDNKKPNSCIINFFNEDDFSQPYFKPPHLELKLQWHLAGLSSAITKETIRVP
ncbi:hypothetical protein ZIOFF_017351 [Zingiber officinale]|uniref:Uncharacterized protein n=1 Tax=Zingiber officinale TaxID=94328 RepID=A0A8J5LII0_ZINOF|nr:hypothetical protein ZIOFF_017351 [Zingiber officinale]